jgi:hypothetical protein
MLSRAEVSMLSRAVATACFALLRLTTAPSVTWIVRNQTKKILEKAG